MRSCWIVGSGPSMIGFDYECLRQQDTITVNQSLFSVPNPTYFVTKDYTWVRRVSTSHGRLSDLAEWKRVESYFVVGMREPRMVRVGGDCVDTKFDLRYRLGAFSHVIYTKTDGGVGLTFEDFRNGGDSGCAALHLAVVLGYDRIFLLGIDMLVAGDRTHCHQDYGTRAPMKYMNKLNRFYRKWVKVLEEVDRRGICQVISCSPISRLNTVLPYQSVEESLCTE